MNLGDLSYQDLRSRGLCTSCRKRSATGARCDVCAAKLSRRREMAGREHDNRTTGPFGRAPMSSDEIASRLGCSRQRVHQLQCAAIQKIQRALGVSRDDVFRSLAILGCAAGEEYRDAVEPFPRSQTLRIRRGDCPCGCSCEGTVRVGARLYCPTTAAVLLSKKSVVA